MPRKKVMKEGDKCPDCGKRLILTLTCEDDACGTTIHPNDGFQIQRRGG